MTRIAALAALLAGCTLITDPSSFEGGDAPDMRVDTGTPDQGQDLDTGDLESLRVEPDFIELAIGQSATVRVLGRFSDDAERDVTGVAELDVLNEGIVELDGATLTATAPGRSLLRATLGTVTVDAPIEVNLGGLPVYTDEFAAGFEAAMFDEAAGSVTPVGASFLGQRALRVAVPEDGFAGFTVVAETPQDLTDFNALTAWVRGESDDGDQVLDVIGYGIDLETSSLAVETAEGIPLSREWQLVILPLPDPERYAAARGMFHLAEGGGRSPRNIFLDEVRYVRVPEDQIETRAVDFPTGVFPVPLDETVMLPPGFLSVRVFDRDLRLALGAGLFDALSSDPSVAAIAGDGFVRGVGAGSAMITGQLRGGPAMGALTAVVASPGGPPTMPAPRPPPRPDASVIGIYTDAYRVVDVDTFAADFSALAGNEERVLSADDVAMRYEEVGLVAIETVRDTVNASRMTHVHFDVWIEDAVPTGLTFRLVDFGDDGVFDGPIVVDDSEAEFRYDRMGSQSLPRLSSGRWIAFDIPLEEFEPGGGFDAGPGIEDVEHLAQYIFGQGAGPGATPVTFWLDNLYFYRAPSGP